MNNRKAKRRYYNRFFVHPDTLFGGDTHEKRYDDVGRGVAHFRWRHRFLSRWESRRRAQWAKLAADAFF